MTLLDDQGSVILRVTDLTVAYQVGEQRLEAVSSVSLAARRGKVVGVVGQSGSGKSTLAASILGTLPANALVGGGTILFENREELLHASSKRLRTIRGAALALIPQNPMISLTPVLTVGSQMVETVRAHSQTSKADARQRAIEHLQRVGVPDAPNVLKRYPHEFSGGTLQRILTAIALLNEPRLVIADEPTSALDATTQRQIIELFAGLIRTSDLSMILISHDIGVVAALADSICVMYAGQIVEEGPANEVLSAPRHPYTSALLAATSRAAARREELPRGAAVGQRPSELPSGAGCRYRELCPHAMPVCHAEEPLLRSASEDHAARCFLVEDAEAASREESLPSRSRSA